MELSEVILQAKRLEEQGEYEEALKLIHNKLETTQDSSEIWSLVLTFSDICLEEASCSFSAGVYKSSEQSLNQALSLLSQKRFSSYKKRMDWKLLRVKLLYRLAERLQKHEEHAEILKILLSIYGTFPKEFEISKEIEHSELELGIALTKAGQFQEAEKYAIRSLQVFERQLKVNKSIPAHQSVCPPNTSKKKFRMLMKSLCLAYHQLGVIRKRLKKSKLASLSIEQAYLLSKKYLKDTTEAKIIAKDYNKSIRKRSRRIVIADKIQATKNTVKDTEKQLLSEIFGSVHPNKTTKKLEKPLGLPKPPLEEISEPTIQKVANLFKLGRPTIAPEEFSDSYPSSHTEKLEIVENPFIETKKPLNLAQLRQLEDESAILIQRAVRLYLSKIDRPEPEEDKKEEIEAEISPKIIYQRSQEQRETMRVQPTERETAGRKQADLIEYLNLETSDISFHKTLGDLEYFWVLRVSNVQARFQELNLFIELVGTTRCLTDTIIEFTALNFDPTECFNEIKMFPFDYSTIWPVVQQVILQWKLFAGVSFPERKESLSSDDSLKSDEQDLDEEAVDKIIGLTSNFIESMALVKTNIGLKIAPKKPVAKDLHRLTDEIDFSGYLNKPGGVIRHVFQVVGHQYEERHEDRILEIKYLERVEENIEEQIIEQGFVRLGNAFYIFTIAISRNYDRFRPENSAYKTFAYIYLKRPGNQWIGEVCVSWERFAQIFQDFDCNFSITFIILTKMFNKNTLELLYSNLPIIFKIEDEQLLLVDKLHAEIKLSSVSEDDLRKLVVKARSIPAVVNVLAEDQEAEIGEASRVLGCEQRIRIERASIVGSKDRFHFEIIVRPDNSILCVAKSCTSDKEYFCVLSAADNLFLKLLESSDEVLKNVALSQFKFDISTTGPVLVYHPVREIKPDRSYSDIRMIDGKRMHSTLVISSTQWSLSLFNFTEKEHFVIDLNFNDLAEYFGIQVPDEVESRHASDQLLKNLRIGRSMVGKRIYWAVETPRNVPTARSKNLFSMFHKSSAVHNMLNPKLLLEQKIADVLGTPSTKLSRCESQEWIVVQRSKIIGEQRCIVSVSRFVALEEWRVRVHILSTCRTYICKLFDSDLLNLSELAFENTSGAIWDIVILKSEIEYKGDKELYFRFDNIISPLRETIYSSYIYKNQVMSLYEVLLKSPFPFNSQFEAVKSMEEAKNIGITIQSYSFKKKIWFQSKFSLEKCVLNLIKDNIIDESLLHNTDIKYPDIQFFAGILCRFVKLKDKKHTYKQKLLPDIAEEPPILASDRERLEHSLSSIYEKDLLLYETVISPVPPCIAGAYYNSLNEEFIIKIYLPRKGLVLRQPFSSATIANRVNFSMAMLNNSIKVNLGKRVLQEFYGEAMENARSARLLT